MYSEWLAFKKERLEFNVIQPKMIFAAVG